jgi:hypothetical protein
LFADKDKSLSAYEFKSQNVNDETANTKTMPMKYRYLFFSIFMYASGFTSPSFALDKRYSPFTPGKSPPKCALVLLEKRAQAASRHNEDIPEIYTGNQHQILISFGDEYSATLQDLSGRKLVETSLQGLSIGFDTVHTFDINNDHKPDYIITHWSGGNGFAAGYAWRTFFLSKLDTYQAITIPSYEPSDEDFIILKNTKSCLFVQTIPVATDDTKDGKYHTFWVYQLMRFEQGEYAYANNKQKDFPKWILYAFKPTHNASTLTIEAKKQHAWENREWGHITEQALPAR